VQRPSDPYRIAKAVTARIWIAGLLLLCAAAPAHAHPGTPPPLPADRIDLADTAQVKVQVNKLKKLHRYSEAKELNRLSVSVIESEFGEQSSQAFEAYLFFLKTLKIADRGALDERRGIAEQAINVADAVFGKESLEKYRAQQQLEGVLHDSGELHAVYESGERRIAALEQLLDDADPRLALALLEFGGQLAEIGRRDEAKNQVDRALMILQSSEDPDPGRLTRTLRVRGRMARQDGEWELAEQMLERALAVAAENFEPTKPRNTRALIQLALLRSDQGHHSEARRLVQEALRAQERAYGEADACLAGVLQKNATILFLAGDTAEAIESYRRALSLLDAEPRHVFWKRRNTQLLNGLARAEWHAEQFDEAIDHALEGHQLARERFIYLIRGLPEREALLQEMHFGSGLDTALSIFANLREDARRARTQRVWDEVVRSRAIVLDETASRNRVRAMAHSGKESAEAVAFQDASARVAQLVLLGSQDAAGDERIREAIRQRDAAEANLAKTSESLGAVSASRRAGIEDVLAALPLDSRLVSFVRFERSIDPAGIEVESFYLAFVGEPAGRRSRVVEIGSARSIDGLVNDWRRLSGRDPRLDAENSIEQMRAVGAKLRTRIWDPIASEFSGARVVFVVPDGGLNLVNLETLPLGDDQYLIETAPMLHLLSAERDLVRFQEDSRSPARGLLAVGAPDFEKTSVNKKGDGESQELAGNYRSLVAECPEFQSLRFSDLPATRSEVKSIAGAWRNAPSKTLVGARASEARFKDLAPEHGIVHIATHGYFVPERCESRGGSVTLSPDPLLYSGLALAGANRRSTTGPGDEDGILTASEIASLDLSKVDWAVLSACESGLGDLRSGEGVLGLRRAFEMAGANTLIMSLWKVEDEATATWMKQLYRERANGLSTIEAVRRADLHLLRLLRQRGRTAHPFFWGGFVAGGDWR